MGAQFIKTAKGEELVLLSRREYDTLLASLVNEEAEDRMTATIIEEARARRDTGEEPPAIPAEIVYTMIAGATAVRAVREFYGRNLDELGTELEMEICELAALDDGSRELTDDERRRVSEALRVDPRWLEPL